MNTKKGAIVKNSGKDLKVTHNPGLNPPAYTAAITAIISYFLYYSLCFTCS